MTESTPMNMALKNYERDISRLISDIPILPHHTPADDPIYEVTAMVKDLHASIDRVDSLKDRLVTAVAQSLDLAKQQLETEFKLVNTPLLASIAEQTGTFNAFGQQLDSMEKRLDRGTQIISPYQWWQKSILGMFIVLLLGQGAQIYLSKGAFLLESPNGQIVKRIAELNPNLAGMCQPLSKQQRKQLGKSDASKGFCNSVLY